MQNNYNNLREFEYSNKFRLSFNNTLVFTGHFKDGQKLSLLGKNVYIPLTASHPAFTFTISSAVWPGQNGVDSIKIEFPVAAARDTIAAFDFTGDTFYVDL